MILDEAKAASKRLDEAKSLSKEERLSLLRIIHEARDKEAQPLLDMLSNFMLEASSIDQLWAMPDNTFALCIDKIAGFLNKFEDTVNNEFLVMALARPEAKGIGVSQLLKMYTGSFSIPATENLRFQIFRTLNKVARKESLSELLELANDPRLSPNEVTDIRKVIKKLS